jgi:hypothetical protein
MSITSSHAVEIDETHPCIITIEGVDLTIIFTGVWGSDEAVVSSIATQDTTAGAPPSLRLTWQEIRSLQDDLNLLNHVITR